VITEDDIFFEDLTGTLPLTPNIQHANESTPETSLLDLSHHRKDPTMHTELKGQVDDLSLDVKQQCLIPINIHFYEDKFWSYIVTKGVGQTKDVDIYDRSISKIFEDVVMGGYDALQTINFSSITVKLKGASPLPLPVCISFIFIAKTGKLSHTFRIRPLITAFDRGRVYC